MKSSPTLSSILLRSASIAMLALAMLACEQPAGEEEGGSTAPAPIPISSPTWLSTIPASPNSSASVMLQGRTGSSVEVRIYTNSACTVLLGSTTSNNSGSFSYYTSVGPNTTNNFYAKAFSAQGVPTECSTAVTYQRTPGAPNVPTNLLANPTGPANNNNPYIVGTTSALAQVNIYSNSSCTTQVASGTADSNGAFNIQVTVADDTTTSFYAKAKNYLNIWSACSTSFATYQEQSTTNSLYATSIGSGDLQGTNYNLKVRLGKTDRTDLRESTSYKVRTGLIRHLNQ